MLVVGDKEAERGMVAPRSRSGETSAALPLDAFIERLKDEAAPGKVL
jgi:threonyl-tRNA synthetase